MQLDFNYDFKTDLVLAGAGGVRLFRQDSPNAFTDVTRETKLSQSVLNARYIGAWAVDIEADGDLDIVLGSSEGVPVVLRKRVGEQYLFIGECYLHGFMDGEAIAMQVKGNLQVQNFVLS